MSTLPDDIEANIFLADGADLVNGKLYVLGGGWASMFAVEELVTLTVASVLAVPWHMTNRKLKLNVELLNEDGVQVVTEEGEEVTAKGELQIGRPPDLRPGTFQNVPFVTPFKPFAIPAGGYTFVLSIDGHPLARARFQVRRRDA